MSIFDLSSTINEMNLSKKKSDQTKILQKICWKNRDVVSQTE